MMIHGCDISVYVEDSTAVRDFIARSIETRWPKSVLVPDVEDYFFYMNKRVQRTWDTKGWTKANDDKSIHVAFGRGEITFVVSERKKDGQTRRIAREIIDAIKAQPHLFGAARAKEVR